jgi:hypothetical protein
MLQRSSKIFTYMVLYKQAAPMGLHSIHICISINRSPRWGSIFVKEIFLQTGRPDGTVNMNANNLYSTVGAP